HQPSPSSLSLVTTTRGGEDLSLPLNLASRLSLFSTWRKQQEATTTSSFESGDGGGHDELRRLDRAPHIDDFSLQNEGTLKRLADDLGPPISGMLDEEWMTMTMSTTISDLLLCILFLQKVETLILYSLFSRSAHVPF
ncbi:hypothetical protein LINGRAHAP2_LOCUS3962, partial [Linum grandiflorum]